MTADPSAARIRAAEPPVTAEEAPDLAPLDRHLRAGLARLTGGLSPAALWLAWEYVALRVMHSLVQATVNRVQPRFALFIASSACLLGLTVLAVLAVF